MLPEKLQLRVVYLIKEEGNIQINKISNDAYASIVSMRIYLHMRVTEYKNM
jgi:hypothetical protein